MAAFNEEECIEAVVDRVVSFLREKTSWGELIVVDDGSNDGTGRAIDELATKFNEVTALHLPKNMGMGAALLEGYGRVQGEWVSMLPGDGQIDPYELPKLFAAADDADLVTSIYGNRKYTVWRKILSYGLRGLTALIVGTRATTEGTYLVRREVLKKLRPISHSFLLNLEIPIRAKRGGYRVRTVSINVSDRMGGVSKAATAGRISRTFRELFKLRLAMAEK